jgi:hypothetical protein
MKVYTGVEIHLRKERATVLPEQSDLKGRKLLGDQDVDGRSIT